MRSNWTKMFVFEDFESFIWFMECGIRILIDIVYENYFPRVNEIIFQYEFPNAEIGAVNMLAHDSFPDRFVFGMVTTYQTTDSRTMNDEDKFVCDVTDKDYQTPRETYANAPCYFYDNFEEEIALAKSLHAKVFKMSLCWPKILPNSFAGPVDEDSVDHIDEIIDEMIENDITPMVTLLDRNTPNLLRQMGGWMNPMMVEWFVAYARIAFSIFGDKVKYWTTIEDPFTLCTHNYGDSMIPNKNFSGVADYLCGHHVLLAHSKVYHLYEREFRSRQKGKVGIVLNYTWFEPEDQETRSDVTGVESGFHWYNGWFTNPLFGRNGDYPTMMKDRISFKSRIQEYPRSRLPRFTATEVSEIKGAADFLVVNVHTSKRVRGLTISMEDEVCFHCDADMEIIPADDCPNVNMVESTPLALGKLLNRLNNDYVLPRIYLTANGYADDGKIEDTNGMVYHRQHIREVLKALRRGIDIRGYLARSPVNNFKWSHDHSLSNSLCYTDSANTYPTCRPKLSTSLISNIFKTKAIPSTTSILETPATP